MSSNNEQNDALNALIDFLIQHQSSAIQWNYGRRLLFLDGVAESDYRRTLEEVVVQESQHYEVPFREISLWFDRIISLRRVPLDEYRSSSSPDPLNLNRTNQPIEHNPVASSGDTGRDARASGPRMGEGAMDGGSVKRASRMKRISHRVAEKLSNSKGKGKAQLGADSSVERSSEGRAGSSKRRGRGGAGGSRSQGGGGEGSLRSRGGGGSGGGEGSSRSQGGGAGWWFRNHTKTNHLMKMFEETDQKPLYFQNNATGNGDGSRSGQISGGSVTVKEEETEEGGGAPMAPERSGSGNRDGESGSGQISGGSVTVKEEETEEGGGAPTAPEGSGSGNRDGVAGSGS